MSRPLFSAIAIVFVACAPAYARDISLTCALGSGNTLPLTIAGKKVLKDGQPLKNFDPKSFSGGNTYIRFSQDFSSYSNAWTINRYNLQITLKTILKAGSRVVLEENGSCTSQDADALQAQTRQEGPAMLSDFVSSWLRH